MSLGGRNQGNRLTLLVQVVLPKLYAAGMTSLGNPGHTQPFLASCLGCSAVKAPYDGVSAFCDNNCEDEIGGKPRLDQEGPLLHTDLPRCFEMTEIRLRFFLGKDGAATTTGRALGACLERTPFCELALGRRRSPST
ncbi:uncharacterized protein B0I36DRAFT_312068 [Microdochium trichocladiopsis]|uniref:Uncharacterized protein n=1 Tax=Microdochium trichocladiopsis TaxID=1682393 RepID=A0A9P8YG36_9PEZI|nr:uncharacterized protein B0I36DRAFT_312068 [Microdochium trichocladiopsis]KAH7041072.1 hypothetical protein B0I36DRAFT_312068 [Microdochium trichocladiopsis]